MSKNRDILKKPGTMPCRRLRVTLKETEKANLVLAPVMN
jgi:hypothetical protein